MLKRILILFALLGMACPALAATQSATLTTGAWTSLGTGPLYLQAQGNDGSVAIVYSASPPGSTTVPLFTLTPHEQPYPAQTALTIYARALTGGNAAIVYDTSLTGWGSGNTPSTPSNVQPPIPATVFTGTVVIGTTGTAVQIPANTLVNGLVVKALSANAAQSSTYTAKVGSSNVTTTLTASSTGYALAPGEASSFAIPNSNLLWVNGTVGDVFTFEGN